MIPLVATAPAYALRRWQLTTTLVGVLACGAVIFILAHPFGATLALGGLTIDAGTSVNVLGRVLAVRSTDQFPLVLLFCSAAILFLIGWLVSEGWTYVPLGLGMLALLSAGLLIRPFVFAGLAFVAAAALGAIMAQADRSGQGSAGGALRYLVVNTLALPAFLGAGYIVSQASNITDITAQTAAYGPAVVLLAIGLGLLFGAFPIFTWTHSVAKDAPPMVVAFLVTVGGGAVCFLALSLMQDFTWLSNGTSITTYMKVLGAASLVFGGLLAWAQRSFGRVVACAASVEIGISLILLSNSTLLAVETVAFSLLVRALSLGTMALGVALIQRETGSDDFASISGHGRRNPWAALAIAAGGLSLAGIPGTAGFVSRWATARVISRTDMELLVVILLAGASVGIGVVRGLAALFATPVSQDETDATPLALSPAHSANVRIAVTVALAVALIAILGIAPGMTAPLTNTAAQNYTFYK